MARRRNRAQRRGAGGIGQGAAGLIGTDFLPFRPYKPPPVPTGSYDPALDAQLGQSQRGLGDLVQDTETAGTRDTVDYASQQGDITQTRDRQFADIDRQVGLLQRGYAQLGGRQTESVNKAGVLGGGALLQAAAKRQANETIDRQPLDTQRARVGQDANTALERLALEMAPPSADSPLGGRRFQDRGTALTRAQREGSQFGIDVNAQRLFQASQAGYVPPGRGQPGGLPTNERISGTGVHTRTQRVGNVVYVYDEHGHVVSRRRARGGGRTAGVVGSGMFGGGAAF